MSKGVSSQFKRLVRFSTSDQPGRVLLGQPVSDDIDVGLAVRQGNQVPVSIFSGHPITRPGKLTSQTAIIHRLYSPITRSQVKTIRCIGLNYRSHAAEVGLSIPETPALFLKPATCLADPWPAPSILPRLTQEHDCGDYEAELAVVIGRNAKNISESDALDYVLGYMAANDVSSRTPQFWTSQWDFSKGFDGSCPLGPTLVSKDLIPDPGALRIKGILNGDTVQDCGTNDMIFSVSQLIAFLSQGTTLWEGTVILTGTPAGVGTGKRPPLRLRAGDEFHVSIQPHIGTLVNVFENEPF